MNHLSTKQQFILLSGIPGSGKSRFGKYLRDKHGFHFIETDFDPIELDVLCSGDIHDYVARWVKRYNHICVEWGFKPCLLSRVLSLKEQGASIFWFICDKEIARLNYFEAHNNDLMAACAWYKQIYEISYVGLPTNDFFTIETYRDRNSIEDLADEIFSHLT
jgi:hypothetical protein